MMTIPFLTLQASSKETIESLSSRLGLNDSLSILEFRLVLMTDEKLWSSNFLIFHAAASFSVIWDTKDGASRLIRQFILYAPTVINDKIAALSQMEVTALRICFLSFTRKVLLSMMTWMKDSNIWLN